jgi:hypothetical protein
MLGARIRDRDMCAIAICQHLDGRQLPDSRHPPMLSVTGTALEEIELELQVALTSRPQEHVP